MPESIPPLDLKSSPTHHKPGRAMTLEQVRKYWEDLDPDNDPDNIIVRQMQEYEDSLDPEGPEMESIREFCRGDLWEYAVAMEGFEISKRRKKEQQPPQKQQSQLQKQPFKAEVTGKEDQTKKL